MDKPIEQLKYLSGFIVGMIFATLFVSFVFATGLRMSLSGESTEIVILTLAGATLIGCGSIREFLDDKHLHALGCIAIGVFFVFVLKYLHTLQAV